MNSLESQNTTIIEEPPKLRPAKGRFFRTSIGLGGKGEDGEKKDIRVGAAWSNKPRGSSAMQWKEGGDPYRFAFGLLYLFTLLLYVRPNDLIPAMGTFPLAKIVAIAAPIAYIYAQYKVGKPIINWTIEVKMIMLMLFLAILFTPVSISPSDSLGAVSDVFIKTVIIFILIIGLVNTQERLQAIIKLTVLCGTWLAVFAVESYATGNLTLKGDRIEGFVGGIFGNPNDLAAALNMLIPLAVALAFMSAGAMRLFYAVCAMFLLCGVMVTFSRAGFITLVVISGMMLWKFGRGSRSSVALATLVGAVILFSVFSGAYRSRLLTILNPSSDTSGSAQHRVELMKRGLELSIQNPIVGIGMGNFHIYSIHEKVAHSGYIEVAAELGVIGLLAYLILILAPLRALSRIEQEMIKPRADADADVKYLSIGLQIVLIAYMINSFFSSIQYLWYLYYPAGFAIALRLIYSAKKAAQAKESGAALPDQPQFGNLWNLAPRKLAGNLWPAYRFRKEV